MLTKDDLKQIRGVMREEIETEGRNIRDDVESKLFETKVRVVTEVSELSNRVKNLEIRTNSLDTKVTNGFKKIANSLNRIQKDVTNTRNFLDNRDIANEKRIKVIERKLQIQTV